MTHSIELKAAALERRLSKLSDRIDELVLRLVNSKAHEYTDMNHVYEYAFATRDIADEFCADLPA